jgi:hypothetical protein
LPIHQLLLAHRFQESQTGQSRLTDGQEDGDYKVEDERGDSTPDDGDVPERVTSASSKQDRDRNHRVVNQYNSHCLVCNVGELTDLRLGSPTIRYGTIGKR